MSPTTLSELLDTRWRALRRQRRTALIPYVTAGYPDRAATVEFLACAADYGADVLELGVPWSDPVADGPVIQASSHAALRGGMSVARVLELLAGTSPSVPVVLFSYLNPILAYGVARFARDAAAAGAAALLTVDVPVDEDPDTEAALAEAGIPLIRLVAPTSAGERLRRIAAASRGFVYLIARLGVTGEGSGAGSDLAARVASVREVTDLPVAIGFGISDPAQAVTAARWADGVVIGSAVVRRMRSGASQALEWLRQVRQALDRKEAS